jgi:hypothetical protein
MGDFLARWGKPVARHEGQIAPRITDRGAFFATENDSLSSFGEAPDGTPVEPVGGIPEDKLNWTTQQFMSAFCMGSIREVMPGQFLNMPILDVMKLA